MKPRLDNQCFLPRPRRSAFTLVEMLVVISIIVVLVAIVVGVSGLVLPRASVERTKINMRVIHLAMDAYRDTDDSGDYPAAAGGDENQRSAALFISLENNPAAREKLASLPGDAIKNVDGNKCFVDGFEMPMDYSHDGGAGGMPVLISAGVDYDFDTEEDNIRSDNK